MIIQNTCIRCRHIGSVVEIQGGNPHIHGLFPAFGGTAFCTRCGGTVYGVKDDQVLPFEFVASWRRLLRAAIWSAIKILVLWLFAGFLVTVSKDGNLSVIHLSIFSGAGVALGFALPWLMAGVAVRNGQVNEPHPPRMTSIGESVVMLMFLLPVVLATVFMFIFLVPVIVGTDGSSMGALGRGLSAAFIGLMTLVTATRELFRHGRKPPPDGKRWQLGEKPA